MNTGVIKSYSYDLTIMQLFEKSVLRHPNHIAVYLDQGNVTYRQFNADVNKLAHYLREKGVSRNLIVGVQIPRSYEMLCAIYAILKAGGTYLPISPDYPEIRKKQIIDNAQLRFLIVGVDQYCEELDGCQTLTFPDASIKTYPDQNLESINQPDDTAYVIYTSGSTGTPKGVMIAHHSLVNRIEWMQDQFPIDDKDVLFQKTHCGFDVSIWELFWWAIAGAGVTLLPHGREDDIFLMTKIIVNRKISVIHFVPSVLRIFLDYLEIKRTRLHLDSLKFVFSSGEALDVKTVNHFNQLFSTVNYPCLVNLYGPTEATVDVTYFVCDKNTDYTEIPIGKPIYNIELMILDEMLQPQPAGQSGELYIAGVGLAKGYLNNPEQTTRCFLTLSNDSGKLIYKTGDLAKCDKNGDICYLGRKDHQVKINGIRIELGEIEYHLHTYPNLNRAVVLYIAPDNYIQKLVAFIQFKNKSDSFKMSDLKSFIQARLPEYMLPKDYLILDKYPLNASGKLDRKKLEERYLQENLPKTMA